MNVFLYHPKEGPQIPWIPQVDLSCSISRDTQNALLSIMWLDIIMLPRRLGFFGFCSIRCDFIITNFFHPYSFALNDNNNNHKEECNNNALVWLLQVSLLLSLLPTLVVSKQQQLCSNVRCDNGALFLFNINVSFIFCHTSNRNSNHKNTRISQLILILSTTSID